MTWSKIPLLLLAIAGMWAIVPLMVWAGTGNWRRALEALRQYAWVMAALMLVGGGLGLAMALAEITSG